MAQHVVLVVRFDEFVAILVRTAPGHVFVEVVRADETGALVAGRYPFHEVEARQVQPAVVVSACVLAHEVDGATHVGRLAEHDEELLVAAVLDVAAEYRELATLRPALVVLDQHPDVGAPIGAGVVRREVGTLDDLVGVGRRRVLGDGRGGDS